MIFPPTYTLAQNHYFQAHTSIFHANYAPTFYKWDENSGNVSLISCSSNIIVHDMPHFSGTYALMLQYDADF